MAHHQPPWKSRLAAIWFVASAMLLIWPVFHWIGNHERPFVLGQPWSLTYVLGIVLINFVVLLALYWARWVDAEEPE